MLTPEEIINSYYLEVRCKLLEIAAIYDRYDRAKDGQNNQGVDDDPRLAKCKKALALLCDDAVRGNRAEQIALIFSDAPYQPGKFEE